MSFKIFGVYMTKLKKPSILRIAGMILAMIICIGILIVLQKLVPGSVRTGDVLPRLGKEPVYVEMKDGESMSFPYTAGDDYSVQALKVLMVNTDVPTGAPEATVDVSAREKASGEVLSEAVIELADIEAGSWNDVSMFFDMEKGKTYSFTFTAHNCEPYFMKVAGYEMGISAGFMVVLDDHVTVSEMFYFSVPLVIMLTVLFELYLIFGSSLFSGISGVISSDKFKKIWNIAFLVLLFAVITLKIYQEGYMDGVYVSADSDGYLREAVNLAAGNGFSYEGLAGYKSHFANWPIIYPALIAFAMVVTGTGAYLASKFVAMAIVALIFIVLWAEFRDRAWLYALAFTNVGFLTLCYYTWSEVPFELFLLIFALALGKIVSRDKPGIGAYILLGLGGTAAFLTRYFGIYAWFVAGFYWLVMLIGYIKGRKNGQENGVIFGKLKGLFISAACSGVACVSYLVMNKLRNGYPTGVARGTWWDDYVTLTDDLFNSLVTEVFNVFSLSIPEYISEMSMGYKALFVLLVIALIAVVVRMCLDKGIMNRGAVLVAMAAFYYVMFIAVRYRSSMDTFYFRFFAPATVLLVMGIIDLVVKKNLLPAQFFCVLAALMSIITIVSLADMAGKAETWAGQNTYYDITCAEWDEAYKEIPEKSTIIWSDIDYRSSWYRPDVYNGELLPDDTWASLTDRYSPSDYICMKIEDARAVVESGEYDATLVKELEKAVESTPSGNKYIIIGN